MPKTKTQKKPKYEPVLQLPPLSYEEFVALKDNIAVNGVLVPILVDSDGPRRKIIDGNYRKQIANELGYECPEIVQADLENEEKRALSRALNLARRHLNTAQKRALIADQLRETPEKSLHWLAKMLGVLRQSVKMCIWLGPPNCYRNQDAVLWTPAQATLAKHRADFALRIGPNGRSYRNGTIVKSVDERGGTTPFNLLPIPTGGRPGGSDHHPAATPYDVAAWWCRYLLPPGGILLNPFVGSGTMLVAALDHGASKVIGIDKEKNYLAIAERRIANG
jgi:DNA modification methylase